MSLKYPVMLLFSMIAWGISAQIISPVNPGSPQKEEQKERNFNTLNKEGRDFFYEDPNHPKQGFKRFERGTDYLNMRLDEEGNLYNYIEANNRALESARNMMSGGSANWQNFGPFISEVGMGRVGSIAFIDSDSWLIGTAGGGLWRTDCAGVYLPGVYDQPWQCLTDQLPVLSIGGVNFNPADPNEIYILTGDGDWSYNAREVDRVCPVTPSLGLFKTTDGGQNWELTSLSFNADQLIGAFKLVRHPTNYLQQYACMTNGLYYTDDAWETFSFFASDAQITDLEFHPTNNNLIYFASRIDFFTAEADLTNVQETTIDWGNGFGDPERIAIAVTPAEQNAVHLITQNDGVFREYLKSSNSGQNFQAVFGPDCNDSGNILYSDYDNCEKGQGGYNFCIAVSPIAQNILHVGGVILSESLSAGLSWDITGEGNIHSDIHVLEYNPFSGQLVVGTDGGIWVYDSGSDDWVPRNHGLAITQFYHIDVDNFLGFTTIAMGGAQDNGTTAGSITGDYEFAEITGGDGFNCHIGQYEGSTLYYSEVQKGILMVTQSSGIDVQTEITPEEEYDEGAEYPKGAWDTPYEMNKGSNGSILAGYRELYYSPNAGGGWFKGWTVDGHDSIPNNHSYSGESRIMDIAWGEDDNHVVHVLKDLVGDDPVWHVWSCDQFVWGIIGVSMPGFNWRSWDSHYIFGGESNQSITDIIFAPVIHENALIATVGGYTDSLKVFQFNGVNSWTNITFNLPNVPVITATVDEFGIYIGTDIGIFFKYYEEDLWSFYSDGLPAVPVTDIEVEEESIGRHLYIGTYGRGMWRGDAASPNRITRWYVNENASGANNGTTWEDAFVSLKLTEDVILPGDSIWIAGGTYFATPNNNNVASRDVSFEFLTSNIKVFGGFAGWEEAIDERILNQNETVISGDNGEPIDIGSNSYHVVETSTAAYTFFDRVTIADGNSNGSVLNEYNMGGGVHILKGGGSSGKSTVFNQCKFKNNHSLTKGGAVYLKDNAIGEIPVKFINCTFESNVAGLGGAIYIDCKSEELYSSADASLELVQCVFENNYASNAGGAIYFDARDNGSIELFIDQCSFIGNSALNDGGAVNQNLQNDGYIANKYSNCTFIENSAGDRGGALFTYGRADLNSYGEQGRYVMQYDTCTFFNNSAAKGGAIYESEFGFASYYGSPLIANSIYTMCSFDSCAATQYGGAIMAEAAGAQAIVQLDLNNSIFTRNQATSNGGAIALYGDNNVTANLSITSTQFSENNANSNGGAIYHSSGGGLSTFEADGALFTENTSTNGGAIKLICSSVPEFYCNVSNSTFQLNHANGGGTNSYGGAVSLDGEGNFVGGFNNCNFNSNLSNSRGGAFSIGQLNVEFNQCLFGNNFSNDVGGAVYVYQAYTVAHQSSFQDCIFENNLSNSDGGAISVFSLYSEPYTLGLSSCNFTGNQGQNGGAVSISSTTVQGDVFLNANDCDFISNDTELSGKGGAIRYIGAGSVDLTTCLFDENVSGNKGGALAFLSTQDSIIVSITDSDFLNCASNNGGAIHAESDGNSHIFGTILACDFDNNQATQGSGAVLLELWDYSYLEFIQSDFTNNRSLHASYFGGAFQAKSFSATDTSLVRLFECNFDNNSSVGTGGAVAFDSQGHLSSIVSKCRFTNNDANSHGGALRAIANGSDYFDIDILDCLFDSNTSGARGGAMSFEIIATVAELLVNVDQCVIVNNTSAEGGAIHSRCNSSGSINRIDMYNTTIANNHATTKCGGLSVFRGNGTVSGSTLNNILWNNTDLDSEIDQKQAYISGTALISLGNSIVEGGTPGVFVDSGDNVYVDPQFVNSTDVDGIDNFFPSPDDGFSLQSSSPAIDAANEIYSRISDIAGTARPLFNGYDIGAYESLLIEENSCVGDLNNDGFVNTTDLLLFISVYGSTCSGCPADLTDDGFVNTSDLLVFVSTYGSSCE